MSQSATLYRVSQDSFGQLERSNNKKAFNIPSISKSYTTFQGSFMALEFILSKGQEVSTIEIISEIFNPKQSMVEQGFEGMTPSEQMEFYADGGFIHYLDKSKVSNINHLLEKISESDIHELYDSKELNDNGIYPDVWHDNNSLDQAFNERQILEDTTELKNIFKLADKDKDYILVFIG